VESADAIEWLLGYVMKLLHSIGGMWVESADAIEWLLGAAGRESRR